MPREDLIQRVAQLDKMIVAHDAFSAALLGIEDCVAKSQFYREPIGSLLLAEGGMGKTTVCNVIVSRFPKTNEQDDNFERTIVPAFYFEIPSPATVKSVAASMLEALGADRPLSGSSANFMTDRLCKLLGKSKTILVFADEFHNLFSYGGRSTKINTLVCNWIKWMVNYTKISFCLVGRPDFASFLLSDSQLTRRFPMHFQLKPLSAGDQDGPGTLVPFVAETMQQAKHRLQLDSVPSMDTLYSATQMYAATGGSPSFVIALVKEAVLNALESGTATVTLENFAAAWDRGGCNSASLTKVNPFRLSNGALATAMRRTI
jgi:Cdc6-like AAA superfamily ATPase